MSEPPRPPSRLLAIARQEIPALGLIAVVLLVGAVFWHLPEWQAAAWREALTARELLELQNELRQTLAVLLLGAGGVFIALALLWRRVTASERAALEAMRVAEETQRSERFSRVVGQLADERLEVRLGAIYALEQLAAESREQHQPSIAVLCAFLRERAAWRPDGTPAGRPPTDVQAVLTVLGRRTLAHEKGQSYRLDLRRTDLSGADLNGVQFAHAVLLEAHLEGASLQRAQLGGADLRGACLDNADLVEADLRGADLREAHLEGAYLVDAHLEGADLGGAHLAGAYLGGASLQGADLGGAHLDGAYLYKANLEGASLHAARAVSTIGVHRDERERINRTAADTEAPPREDARPPEAPARPILVRRR